MNSPRLTMNIWKGQLGGDFEDDFNVATFSSFIGTE